MRKIIAVAAAPMLVLGIAAAAIAPATATTTSRVPVYYEFPVSSGGWDGVVRPHVMMFSEDGTLYARHVHWRHWTRTSAYSTGQLRSKLCIPSCAQGHYRDYAASFTLWRSRDHRGQPYYSRMTTRFWKNGHKHSIVSAIGRFGPNPEPFPGN